jgi:hypothetical protein
VILGGGKPPSFAQTTWPDSKRAIERFVVERSFGRGIRGPDLRKLYRLVAEPRINPEENGFDVILTTEAGEQYLELVEVAPLHRAGGSYDNAPISYFQGGRADVIFGEFLKKSTGYGTSPRATVHLLVYSTDFRFFLEPEVLDLLAYRALRGELCFASIVYYERYSDDDERLELIYPRSASDWERFDEAGIRDRQVTLGDLSTMEALPNGGVALKLGPVQPPGPGPVTFTLDVELAGPDEVGKAIPPRRSVKP